MTTILVIDDDRQIREAIGLTIEQDNECKVIAAADGLEGEAVLRRLDGRVDLVITDIFMPDQDGLQTIINIRKRWPLVKIIAMTGSADDNQNYLRHALLFGANRALMKPFRVDDLLVSVQACLRPGEDLLDILHAPPRGSSSGHRLAW